MTKGRLEAFSDGVIAILITIMVLELKPPSGADWAAIDHDTRRSLFTYLLSFLFIATYWNNHHHMLHAARRVNGAVLWANMHLLFWLSLVPYVTTWMANQELAALPTAAYGLVMLLCGAAFNILANVLVRANGPESPLAKVMGKNNIKGRISVALYVAAVPLAFVRPILAVVIYAIVALMWLVPDRRVERVLGDN